MQGLQIALFVEEVYVPGEHLMQESEPETEKVPVGQLEQEPEPLDEYSPALHGKQIPPDDFVPAGHFSH